LIEETKGRREELGGRDEKVKEREMREARRGDESERRI